MLSDIIFEFYIRKWVQNYVSVEKEDWKCQRQNIGQLKWNHPYIYIYMSNSIVTGVTFREHMRNKVAYHSFPCIYFPKLNIWFTSWYSTQGMPIDEFLLSAETWLQFEHKCGNGCYMPKDTILNIIMLHG